VGVSQQYKKMILREDIARRVEEVFREIAQVYEFEIETMAVVENHIHSCTLSLLQVEYAVNFWHESCCLDYGGSLPFIAAGRQ